MTNEPRKATEVLLELEAKIDALISLVKAQSFAMQLVSNKINELTESFEKQRQATPPQIKIDTVNTLPQAMSPLHTFTPTDPEREIPISSDKKLPILGDGFRRTARPETFAGDDVYLGQQFAAGEQPKMPLQIPKGPPPGRGGPEVIIPDKQVTQQVSQAIEQKSMPKQTVIQNAVPVVQRVVNGNGQSQFLAEVEIVDMATSQSVVKTRTNGTGKWMASLGVGAYRVSIRKKGTATNGKMEAIQDIQVDGSKSPLELNTIIIK